MSIIKLSQPGQGAPGVRPLSAPRTEPPVDPRLEALRDELDQARTRIAALVADLSDRDAAIARLDEEARQAVSEARAEGREAGLKAAEDDGARRLDRLGQGVEAALDRFAAETDQMERLAVAIAAEGLRKLVGAPDIHRDLLARTIRHNVDAVAGETVIEVTVSRDDFADPQDLERLADAVARPGLKLSASPDLGQGDCQVRLKLGALEIGVERQRERLNAVFASLGAWRAAE